MGPWAKVLMIVGAPMVFFGVLTLVAISGGRHRPPLDVPISYFWGALAMVGVGLALCWGADRLRDQKPKRIDASDMGSH